MHIPEIEEPFSGKQQEYKGKQQEYIGKQDHGNPQRKNIRTDW
jgi:hypothetical protein